MQRGLFTAVEGFPETFMQPVSSPHLNAEGELSTELLYKLLRQENIQSSRPALYIFGSSILKTLREAHTHLKAVK